LAALLVFRLTKSKIGAALAPLLVLSAAYVGRYGISARADMVALLLSTTGFFVFYTNRESRRSQAIAAGLMLLSFFYKQQFIGAPVAVLLYFLISRRLRDAATFALLLTAGGLLLVGVFAFLVFPNQPFVNHFLMYNHLPFEKRLLLPEILMFVVPLFVPLLGSADFVESQRDFLLKCYAIVPAVLYFFLLFSSGSGADTNRCLEGAFILMCLLAARIATAEGLMSGVAWTGAAALTFLVVAALGSAFVVPEIHEGDFAVDREFQSYLRQNFGPGTSVLTYYPADPVRAGLEAPITNLWHYSALIHKGVLSDHDIVSRIQARGYGAILLDFELQPANISTSGEFYTTASIRQAVLQNYIEKSRLELPTPEMTRFGTKLLHVWVPRPVIPGERQ